MPEIITPGKHETLPCKFCHTPLEVGEGLVCRFCKGLEEQYPAPVEVEESLRVCGVCGDYFGQYKNGSQTVRTICNPCLKAKRLKTYKKTVGNRTVENTKKIPPWEDAPPDVVEQNRALVLDFQRYPWALAWLREEYGGDVNLALFLVREQANQVPAEWLKRWMIETA